VRLFPTRRTDLNSPPFQCQSCSSDTRSAPPPTRARAATNSAARRLARNAIGRTDTFRRHPCSTPCLRSRRRACGRAWSQAFISVGGPLTDTQFARFGLPSCGFCWMFAPRERAVLTLGRVAWLTVGKVARRLRWAFATCVRATTCRPSNHELIVISTLRHSCLSVVEDERFLIGNTIATYSGRGR
jgi:hypothetical protein